MVLIPYGMDKGKQSLHRFARSDAARPGPLEIIAATLPMLDSCIYINLYTDSMDIRLASGFEWDDGNLAKCQKHGVSIGDIEAVFRNQPMVSSDAAHSGDEQRLIAIGKGSESRLIFVVFTLRETGDDIVIRPISARYMHQKEIDGYEEDAARPAH